MRRWLKTLVLIFLASIIGGAWVYFSLREDQPRINIHVTGND